MRDRYTPATWSQYRGRMRMGGPAPPRLEGTRVASGTLHSAFVPQPVDYAVGLPPGTRGTRRRGA